MALSRPFERICLYCEDPGPTRIAIEAAREWRAAGIDCLFVATGLGAKLLNEEGITYHPAAAFDGMNNVTVFFFGTSENPNSPLLSLREVARHLKIPDVAVIDATVGFEKRFRYPGTELPVLPHTLIIFDDWLRGQFIAQGMPGERIFLANDPLRQRALARKLRLLQTGEITGMRQKHLIPGCPRLLLLVSDGSTALYRRLGKGESFGSDPWLAAAYEAGWRLGFSVVLRPHPKDEAGDYPLPPNVALLDDTDPLPAVLAADFVLGSGSKLLHEAYWMGKPVLSVRSDTGNPENFAPVRQGLIPQVELADLSSGSLVFSHPEAAGAVEQAAPLMSVAQVLLNFLPCPPSSV